MPRLKKLHNILKDIEAGRQTVLGSGDALLAVQPCGCPRCVHLFKLLEALGAEYPRVLRSSAKPDVNQ